LCYDCAGVCVVCYVGVDGVGCLLVSGVGCYGGVGLAYVWWLAVVDDEDYADGVVDVVGGVVCDVEYGVFAEFVCVVVGVVVGVGAAWCECYGVVMFACTVSICVLSVAFVVMLIVVPWLMAIPVGLRLSICGALWSFMVKVVVMVLLMLLLVSFAGV